MAEATSIAVEIVKRKPDQVGFAMQPRRRVVERFFARNRRLWNDAEASIESATAAAAVMILVRRIARHQGVSQGLSAAIDRARIDAVGVFALDAVSVTT